MLRFTIIPQSFVNNNLIPLTFRRFIQNFLSRILTRDGLHSNYDEIIFSCVILMARVSLLKRHQSARGKMIGIKNCMTHFVPCCPTHSISLCDKACLPFLCRKFELSFLICNQKYHEQKNHLAIRTCTYPNEKNFTQKLEKNSKTQNRKLSYFFSNLFLACTN